MGEGRVEVAVLGVRGGSAAVAHDCGPAGRTVKENTRPISEQRHFLYWFYQMTRSPKAERPLEQYYTLFQLTHFGYNIRGADLTPAALIIHKCRAERVEVVRV